MNLDELAAIERRMWVRYETCHDVTYFTPESRAVTDALGCKGGWMGYFGMRAAPLGAASAEQVTSAFYNFHPAKVGRALPDAWAIASPERFLRARLEGVDAALRRLIGEQTLSSPELAEAAELIGRAARLAATGGRPLALANSLLPTPAQPHLALWQAATVLRESRGDGHVAALIAEDLDPVETLVIFAADHGLDADYLRNARGWPVDEWAAGADRLRERGLLGAGNALTEDGARLRASVELRTDRAAARPWRELGVEATQRLADLLRPLARTLVANNDVMRVNPMALNAEKLLAS